MKKFYAFLIAASIGLSAFAGVSSVIAPPAKPASLNAADVMIPVGKSGEKVSLLELSTMKVKELEQLTGKKMNLAEKLRFKVGQKQLSNSIDANGTINTKKMEKAALKAQKAANDKSRKYLRLWLLLAGAAIVLYILGIFLTPLFIVAYLASLASAVFFVLWIIALSGDSL